MNEISHSKRPKTHQQQSLTLSPGETMLHMQLAHNSGVLEDVQETGPTSQSTRVSQ